MTSASLKAAQRVLSQSTKGLQALEKSLGASFERAVERIATICHENHGHLVVCGMGKSGHVGRKIAATLASTGTPSHFVHPAEASHGDLGMITKRDALLLLSNSGETKELHDVIYHAKRIGIPIIAIVGREPSTLQEAADIALVLPEHEEASITGAPTTSTTLTMALGDALAMALLEKRGFTPQDFATFHPGGKLGQAFLRVKELMHSGEELPLVKADTVMSDVLLEMTARRFGCAGVVNANRELLGIITDGDLRRNMRPDLLSQPAEKIMTHEPITIAPEALAAEAVQRMNSRNITSLFVVDGKTPVGILHIHDCLRAGVV